MYKNKNKMPSNDQQHVPVLLNEVLELLDPKPGESYLDATAGRGGHAEAVISLTKSPEKVWLVDRDRQALEYLADHFGNSHIIGADFLEASRELQAEHGKFDMILADLGISSPHLNQSDRGFSFMGSGPLDMRMDQRQPLSAETIVNRSSEKELVHILKEYGQEPKAHQIAKRIISARPIATTEELAAVVAKAWPGHSRHHPATRTFQALRIAVNDELAQIEQALPVWLDLLAPGGRIAVISFHSLEDRIIKQFFAQMSDGYEAQLEVLTKKPIVASPNEIVSNPRARSAKLRAASKIKTKRKD